jgi:CBS domain containing-hemolysin-like protein
MNQFWLLVLLLLLAIFFAGVQISFNSCNKLRFELEIKQSGLVSRIIPIYLKNPSFFIFANKIGYTLSVGMLAISFADLFYPYFYNLTSVPLLAFLIGIILTALIIIGIAEFTAQTLFRIDPNLTLRVCAVPSFFFFVSFLPIVWLIINLLKFLLQMITPGKVPKESLIFGKPNTSQWLEGLPSRQDKNESNTQELKIFQKALVFSKVRIRDCMIPRTEIEAIHINAGIEELRKKFISSGYSKIIVYRNSIDHVVGYVNCKELFKHPATIKEKLNQITFVPETMQANRLLHDFMQYHRSAAVVVDEYGGTSGLVTLEDIMEEIFGEIKDEHDTDDLIEKQISPREYILSSRFEIEYLNTKYNLKIPESEDYDTLAGFILYNYQNLPKHNTVIKIENYVFKVLRVSQTRIELVHLEVKEG